MRELGNEQCHPVVRLQLCCPAGGGKVAVPAGAEVPELHVQKGKLEVTLCLTEWAGIIVEAVLGRKREHTEIAMEIF